MIIIPSADIRQNYNRVSKLCKESGEPVYLTKNGKGDLVILDIATFERMQQELALWEAALEGHERFLSGEKTYSVEETFAMINAAVGRKHD